MPKKFALVAESLRATFDKMQNTTNTTEMEKNIALAGVCQAAMLVKQVAKQGTCDDLAFKASIASITITEPENTEQVFGQLDNVKLGFTALHNQLGNSTTDKDTEITRYIANLLSIERKLSKNDKLMTQLGERINNIKRQQLHLDLFDSQMLTNLASIYSDVISPMTTKVQVSGDPALLKNSDNQHKVRALLLAGVRAAVLWRQLGGKRRHILFNRQRIVICAEQALAQINQPR
ncbi:MAG: high frequency lysogenization protein [Paraglaciecola sp.]|jgi:high frequency lysogenization protein